MEKIPGCWEHLSMVWHAPKEARAQNSNSAVIWLDNGKMRLLIHFVEGHPSSLSLITLVKFFVVNIDHHVPPFIANAYGFIPHKLIVFAIHRYGVSPQWMRLIETYYKAVFSKSFSQSATSSWHRHQCGIFAGCTLSIILFLAGMNIILEYSLQARAPQFTTNNTALPLLRAFMDDLSLMSVQFLEAKLYFLRA